MRDAISSDVNHFRVHWDLTPWRILVGRQQNAQPPLKLTAAAPLVLPLGLKDEHLVHAAATPSPLSGRNSDAPVSPSMTPPGFAPGPPDARPDAAKNPSSTGEYRLEVVGKRSGKAGGLTIQFPLPSGGQLSVPVTIEDRGELHVLISVYTDHVSADLGFNHPIDMSKPLEPPGGSPTPGSLTLSTDGSFIIDSVRVKPVVEGSPPDAAGGVELAAATAQPALGVADLFPVGSTWSGTMHRQLGDPMDLRAAVKRATGNVMVLEMHRGGAAETWKFTVNGNQLTLTELISGRKEAKIIDSSGTVADGQITLSTHFVWPGSNGQNATLTLTKDK
jgi:hypothetical protein